MSYKFWITDVKYKIYKVEMYFVFATCYVKQNLQEGNFGYQLSWSQNVSNLINF